MFAKLCKLSGIKPVGLETRAKQWFALEGDSGCFVDRLPAGHVDEFAQLIGERARWIRLQSIDSLHLEGYLAGIVDEPAPMFDRLAVCDECLSYGYHSNWHQYRWLTKCFLHGTALRTLQPHDEAPTDLALVKDLFGLMFTKKSWLSAHLYEDWNSYRDWLRVTRDYLGTVPRLRAMLRSTSAWRESKGRRVVITSMLPGGASERVALAARAASQAADETAAEVTSPISPDVASNGVPAVPKRAPKKQSAAAPRVPDHVVEVPIPADAAAFLAENVQSDPERCIREIAAAISWQGQGWVARMNDQVDALREAHRCWRRLKFDPPVRALPTQI